MFRHVLAWNDNGDLAWTENIRASSPKWTSIKGNIQGRVNDVALDWSSEFITSGYTAGALKAFAVATEGSTLRVYKNEDLAATEISWVEVKQYPIELSLGVPDTSVDTAARVVTSKRATNLVFAAWRSLNATYFTYSTDAGENWSSSPQRSGDKAWTTDVFHANQNIGVALSDTDLYLGGYIEHFSRRSSSDISKFSAPQYDGWNRVFPIPGTPGRLHEYGPYGPVKVVHIDEDLKNLFRSGLYDDGYYQEVPFSVSYEGTPFVDEVLGKAYTTTGGDVDLTTTISYASETIVTAIIMGASPVGEWDFTFQDSDHNTIHTISAGAFSSYPLFGGPETYGFQMSFDPLYNVKYIVIHAKAYNLEAGSYIQCSAPVSIAVQPFLYLEKNFTGNSQHKDITPFHSGLGRCAPTHPYALSLDETNENKIAVLAQSKSRATCLFLSNDQGTTWIDRGLQDYHSVARSGDMLLLGGTDRLDLSKNLGLSKRSALGNWAVAVGGIGTIRGIIGLVEDYNSETKAVVRGKCKHDCQSCNDATYACYDSKHSSAPVSLLEGEKRETVTDLTINTPSGALTFTRFYRQSKQLNEHYRHMGLGWTHNHYARLEPSTETMTLYLGAAEARFTEAGTDHFLGEAGSSAFIDVHPSSSSNERYTLVAMDKSTYVFDSDGWLRQRRWANGDVWEYSYTTTTQGNTRLEHVTDVGYELPDSSHRRLNFEYDDFDQLERVVDHSGRAVEFGYHRAKVEVGGTIQDGTESFEWLLAEVTDVRDETWAYTYYGQSTEEIDAAQLNHLTRYISPPVDLDGGGNLQQIVVKELSYVLLPDKTVSEIVEKQGVLEGANPLRETMFTFGLQGEIETTRITEETTAGRTANHLFAGEVFAGTKDALGNYSATSLYANYRPEEMIDANGNTTAMEWIGNGSRLSLVTNALDQETKFEYDLNDDLLLASTDALGRKTEYSYNDELNPRLPTSIKVFVTDGGAVLSHQKFAYDEHGRVTSEEIIDPLNEAIRLRWTTRAYHPDGNNGVGLLAKLTQKDVQNTDETWTEYSYDSLGRVVFTKQSSLFGSCSFTYTIFDEVGNVVRTVCSSQGVESPESAVTTQTTKVTEHEYDSMGRRIKTMNAVGASYAKTTLTVYDALNRVERTIGNYVADISVPNPYTADRSAFSHGADHTQNLVTDTEYNERGFVRKQIDVLGNVTLYGYDDADRLVKTVQNASDTGYNNSYTGDPDLSDYVPNAAADQDLITFNTYDAVGNLVKTVDAAGRTSYTVCDALNRLVKTVRNAKASATIEENVGGLGYVAANDPRSVDYVLSADPDRDMIETTDYDAMGRMVRTARLLENRFLDAEWDYTLYGYDALGRQVRVIRSASQPEYDIAGDPDLSEYGASGAGDQDLITSTEYDNTGRVLWTQDVMGSKTWFKYDGLGRTVKVITSAVGTATDGGINDPRSDSYVPSTDPDKDLITVTAYDADGRVQWTQDPLGRKTWNVYDSLGRLKRVVQNYVEQGSDPSAWILDNGEWTTGGESPTPVDRGTDNDQNLVTETVYDAQGRAFRTFDQHYSETRRIYDAAGRVIRVIRNYVAQGEDAPETWVWNNGWKEADGTTPIEHGVYNDLNLVTDTVYDAAGRVYQTFDHRHKETRNEYDALGRRVKTITNHVNGEFSEAYPDEDLISTTVYNKAGQVIETTDPRGTKTTFSYDAAGRRVSVIQAAGTPLATTSYTCYDKAGRVRRTIAGYESLVDASGNPLLPDVVIDGEWTFVPAMHGLDADTNLITAFDYDRAGRRIRVTDPVGSSTETDYYKDGQVEAVMVIGVEVEGDPTDVETKYRYDALRRRTLVVQNYDETSDPATWAWTGSSWED